MGMFDKDKAIGLVMTELIPQGEEFVLWGARVLDGTVATRFGQAEQAELDVTRKQDRDRIKVTTLGSAIVDKVKEAEPTDFPAVVMWTKVDTAAREQVLVLRFLRPLRQDQNVAEEPTPPPVSDAPAGH